MVGILGVDAAAGTLDVINEVVEVVAGEVADVVNTRWVVGPSTWAAVTGDSVERDVCGGDHDGSGPVVASVRASTLPVTGCVVSATGSTTTGLRVVEAGGAPVAVVSATLHTGGGVASFLVVVAGTSADERSAAEVVVAAAEVAGVIAGVEVTAAAAVVVVTLLLVSDGNAGVVAAVEVWTGVEVVSARGEPVV